MSNPDEKLAEKVNAEKRPPDSYESVCPACGHRLIEEKCKLVCRSPRCGYRIVYNCSEF